MKNETDAVTYDNGVLSIKDNSSTIDYVVRSNAQIFLVLKDKGLMADAGADYEVMANITAENLFRTLRGYTLTSATYYAETDSDTGELVYLYMTVGTAAEDMTATFTGKATTDANSSITAISSVTAATNGNVTVTASGSADSGDVITVTATVAEGATANGSIVLTYNGSIWTATGSITVIGVDGTVVTYPSTGGTISVTIS